MTPVRAPDLVRGTDLRELPRCMPVIDLRPATRFNGEPVTRRGVYVGNNTVKADEGLVVWTHYAHVRDEWPTYIGHLAIDWSDRAAIYLSLAWLADRGFLCLWMLPTTHGGREACSAPARPAWVNKHTPLLYCWYCANLINRYNPGFCTPESEASDE